MNDRKDRSEPSSDGFPKGLLDQPFYGWVAVATSLTARFNGLLAAALALAEA
jgi:hypothetical protein